MLLTIFGAGASYDSAPQLRPQDRATPEEKWRPPLTDGLFTDREEFREFITEFPGVLPLIARLGQASPSLPLEGMLAQLEEEAQDYPARGSHLVAIRYHIQRIIWECERHWLWDRRAVTNYVGLLDRIQRWSRGASDAVMFATFNYDRLFEYAATYCATDGRQVYESCFDTMASYIEQSCFPVVKLHGSLDWGFKVNTPLDIVGSSGGNVWQIAHEVIRRFPTLDVSDEPVRIVERPPEPQDGHAYVPALAIPTNRKAGFACPRQHLDFLVDRLPNVRALLTIGWRGIEPHALEVLRDHIPSSLRVMAVAGSLGAAQETLEHLHAARVGSDGQAFSGGFSDFVLSTDADAFLSSALL